MLAKTKKSILKFENVSLVFGKEKILEDLNFEIFSGEYLGLIGPNGAGKSSLLLTILKHHKPSKGKIFLAPKTVIGYVPQNLHLGNYFSLSVAEFLAMGIREKLSRLEQKELMLQTLEEVGMGGDFLLKNFHLLSNGQQKRVVIARAIIHKPNFLLFDEPLNEVDYKTKEKIYQLLTKFNETYKITILFVSHELNYIAAKTDRVLCLDKKLFDGCHPLNFHGSNTKVKPASALVHHHH